MDKPILYYINDYVGVNYAGMRDFLKDLAHNSPEYNTNILVELLLHIEATEKEGK